MEMTKDLDVKIAREDLTKVAEEVLKSFLAQPTPPRPPPATRYDHISKEE